MNDQNQTTPSQPLHEVDSALRRRRLRSKLRDRIIMERGTCSWDTLTRAFDPDETPTDLILWIRKEAESLLLESLAGGTRLNEAA